jgi:hypothetical protein
VTTPAYDALILVDPRFMGGTAMAVETDVRALQSGGLKVGLHFINSTGFFLPHETPNPKLSALLDLPGVEPVRDDRPARARAAFFHHPEPFQTRITNPIIVDATTSVVICHQAPFKGDGALGYDPFTIQRRIARQFRTNPFWAPISGICRAQLSSFAPLLRLTQQDWPNSFHTGEWQPGRTKFTSQVLTVGRHGRPHPDKWGDTPAGIAASLPADAQTRIRTMGTDRAFFTSMGLDTAAWDILPFNAEPVPAFLGSLDVFSYFHHSRWTETFGRTVAEAMLMGARCILQPGLEATFGRHAIYCAPQEVSAALDTLRADLPGARAAAMAAREWCITSFAADAIPARFESLARDRGTLSRQGRITASPLTAARRWAGFHRRRLRSKA